MQEIPLVTRRLFDFSDVRPSGAVNVIMVKQLSVAWAAQADLVVRVHSVSFGTGAPAGRVRVVASQYSQDPGDPGVDFVGSTTGVATVDNTDSAGSLKVVRLATPYGSMLRFVVRGWVRRKWLWPRCR